MDRAVRLVAVQPKGIGDFLILAEVNDYYIDYRCYECVMTDEDRSPFYERSGGSGSCDWVSSPAEAQVFLSGSIKWDGCANLHFDAQNDCMLHFCGRSSAAKVGRLMDRLYDLTEELLPTYDKELGE